MIPVVSFLSGVAAFHAFQYFPYLTVLASITTAVLFARKKKYLLVALIASGVIYAFIRYSPPLPGGAAFPERMQYSRQATVSGFFKAPAVRLEHGFSQEFKVGSGSYPETLRVFSEREFEIGKRHKLKVRIITPRKRLNPGSRQRNPYAVLMKVQGTGETNNSIHIFFNRLRDRLRRFFEESFEPDRAALLTAVTTGQKAYLDNDLREDFNSAGLAHLLSISGTHFAFFSILLFGMFRTLIRYLPGRLLERVTVYVTPSQAAAFLCLPFMLFYLGISGASIPSIRAFIMISLFLLGLLINRKGGWLSFLLLAALVLVLWEPEVIFSISFQLSFTAVLFIGGALTPFSSRFGEVVANSNGKKEWVKRLQIRSVKRGGKLLYVSLAASVGIAPLVAYYFHYMSIISPVSNLIVTPLVGFLLVPMSLAGSLLYLLTGSYFVEPLVGWVSHISIHLVRAFASIPYSSIKIPLFPVIIILLFYTGFLLYWLSNSPYREHNPRRRSGLLTVLKGAVPFLPVLIYSVFVISSHRPLSVTFLDAGRAEASIIELPDRKVIVLDTGRTGKEVADYLRLKGITAVHALVLTHSHPDHTGGAGHLIERFEVRELWDNGVMIYPEGFLDGLTRRGLKRGDFIEGEGYRLHVFHPYSGFYTAYGNRNTEKNNSSLVLKLTGRKHAFLFTGDIESEAEEDVSHLGSRLKSDVLKVPHHGLKTSAHEAFFAAVSPEFAVITSWKLNSTVNRLLKGASVLRTGTDGAVKIEEQGEGLGIKTYRDFNIRKAKHLKEELRNIKRLFMTW